MPLSRRALLGAGATAALATSALSGCSVFTPPDQRQPVSSTNPFGVPKLATIEAIASGPLGAAVCDLAAEEVKAAFSGATITLSEVADLEPTGQRFAHTPPDLIVNSGSGALAMSPLLDQVVDLTPMLSAPSYPEMRGEAPGPAISELLVPGTVEAGSANDKLVAFNYVRVVHGLWYSTELFAQRTWTPPQTWDQLLNMAADTSSDGVAVIGTVSDDILDLQTLVIDSAIKQGGDEVRLGLENLEPKAWQHPAVQSAMAGLHQLISAGGVKMFSGRSTLHQAWVGSKVVMIPAPSWLDWQTAYLRPREFTLNMTAAPVSDPATAWAPEGVHAAPEQPVLIPAKGRDPWGGQELLRAMISPRAAEFVAKQRFMLPVIRDVVPDDGFGSPGLAAQVRAVAAAGEHTFGWRFVSWYRLETEQVSWWKRFASGDLGPKDLAQGLQNISDKVRDDSSVVKVPVR